MEIGQSLKTTTGLPDLPTGVTELNLSIDENIPTSSNGPRIMRSR